MMDFISHVVTIPIIPRQPCMTIKLERSHGSSIERSGERDTIGMEPLGVPKVICLTDAKEAGFKVTEIVTDKDSYVKPIYLQHFPEGRVTFCSNHCAKALHKDLKKIKQAKCQVNQYSIAILHTFDLSIYLVSFQWLGALQKDG